MPILDSNCFAYSVYRSLTPSKNFFPYSIYSDVCKFDTSADISCRAFCRPVRHFFNKSHSVPWVCGCFTHKVVLHLCHTVCYGLNNKFVKVFEINLQVSCSTVAGLCQCLNSRAGQTFFRIAFKAFFHNFLLSFIMLLFCSHMCIHPL